MRLIVSGFEFIVTLADSNETFDEFFSTSCHTFLLHFMLDTEDEHDCKDEDRDHDLDLHTNANADADANEKKRLQYTSVLRIDRLVKSLTQSLKHCCVILNRI